MLWTQIALEKELGTCIPTVLQGNIKTILLNAVRTRWNNNNCVLLTVKSTWEYILVYTHIYCYNRCILAHLRIEAMKTLFWHVEWITACTHHPSEKFGLPLHTAKCCQFTRDDMVVQDIVELGRCPPGAWLCYLICFIWKPKLLLHVLPYPLSQLCRQPAQGRVGCPVNILQPLRWSSPIWQSQRGSRILYKLEFAGF